MSRQPINPAPPPPAPSAGFAPSSSSKAFDMELPGLTGAGLVFPTKVLVDLALARSATENAIQQQREAERTSERIAAIRELWRQLRIASDKINAICMVCGDAATTDRHGVVMTTLCPYHHPDAREARGDTRPLHELTVVPRLPAGDSGGGA